MTNNIENNIKLEKINARELLKRNNRFDLIIKYLYVKAREENLDTKIYEELYKEHIMAFNGFKDNHKQCFDDFISSFHSTIDSIKAKGFDEKISTIRVNDNYELYDGSHRVATAAYFNLPVMVEKFDHNANYNYYLFSKKGLNQFYCDVAALEYCKFDKDIFIVNLQPRTSIANDFAIEEIIRKYGQIFYKKNVYINKNGHLRLKLISYGSQFKEGWIGNYSNNFKGARKHVKRTTGESPLRAYIVKGLSKDDVLKLKREIRDFYKIENFSVHINDTPEEALELAQTYFNENSVHFINNSPVKENKLFAEQFDYLKTWLKDNNIDSEGICIDESSFMTAYCIREGRDLDFLHYKEDIPKPERKDVSRHNQELKHYTFSKDDIIFNPKNHFYFKSLKFISLEVLLAMKQKRAEYPKDFNDIKLIKYKLKPSKSLFVKKVIFNFLTQLITHWRCFKHKPFKYLGYALQGRLKRII